MLYLVLAARVFFKDAVEAVVILESAAKGTPVDILEQGGPTTFKQDGRYSGQMYSNRRSFQFAGEATWDERRLMSRPIKFEEVRPKACLGLKTAFCVQQSSPTPDGTPSQRPFVTDIASSSFRLGCDEDI